MIRLAVLLLGAFFLAATTAGAARVVGGGPSGRAQSVTVVPTSSTLPLRTGIFDPALFDTAQAPTAFAMTRAAGARYVRLFVNWSRVAPTTRPHGFNAADPADYDWAAVDASVLAAVRAGLTPMLDAAGAPAWALLPGRIDDNHAGVPSTYQLGRFATALATHYDGRHGAPAVHVFQVWNEPNNTRYLSPTKEADAPAVYRGMINVFAASVHAVNPANIVVAGALDPFGHPDYTTFQSLYPMAFMRGVLCLSRSAQPKPTCASRAHFDVWSHHPYTYGGPFGHAANSENVSLGDLPEMEALLHAGVRTHQIVSSRPVQFWVTEFGWDTSPPRPGAASLDLEARWTSEGLYQMWCSGVSVVTWFLLQDMPGNTPYKSGLYRASSRLTTAVAKPMVTSFRFPFVAYLGADGRTVTVWGRDATSAKATVTLRLGHAKTGPWRRVAIVQANRYGIFSATLTFPRVSTSDWLMASAPGAANYSLPFSLTVPPPNRIGPWG